MLPETTIAGIFSFILMLVAIHYRRHRNFHAGSMGLIVLFDLSMPFYLYLNRDWYERLIEGGEIFSFLIWMHVGIVLTVYALYTLQIKEGLKLRRGDESTRTEHANFAKGIVLARALMIMTGALLYEPED